MAKSNSVAPLSLAVSLGVLTSFASGEILAIINPTLSPFVKSINPFLVSFIPGFVEEPAKLVGIVLVMLRLGKERIGELGVLKLALLYGLFFKLTEDSYNILFKADPVTRLAFNWFHVFTSLTFSLALFSPRSRILTPLAFVFNFTIHGLVDTGINSATAIGHILAIMPYLTYVIYQNYAKKRQ